FGGWYWWTQMRSGGQAPSPVPIAKHPVIRTTPPSPVPTPVPAAVPAPTPAPVPSGAPAIPPAPAGKIAGATQRADHFTVQLGLGVGAGVNAYATLLVFGLLARWHPSMFHDDLAKFFASTPVLVVIGALYLVEFVADKVPTIDHIWDVIHTFIRPVAGGVVAF